jgi:uncharacterized protein YbbC (DUF1343 family)
MPGQDLWRQPPYEYEKEKLPFDILSGSSRLREQIEAGIPAERLAEGWREDETAFAEAREPFLLY